MTVDENTYEGGEVRMKRKRKRQSRTSAVPEVVVGGRVVLAEPLQDELVVQQAVQRPEEEDVEGQVANSLLLEVSTHGLHLTNGPEGRRCSVAFQNAPTLLFSSTLFSHQTNYPTTSGGGGLRSHTCRPAPVPPGTLNVSGGERSAAADPKE